MCRKELQQELPDEKEKREIHKSIAQNRLRLNMLRPLEVADLNDEQKQNIKARIEECLQKIGSIFEQIFQEGRFKIILESNHSTYKAKL